jgi:ribulose kinase
MRLFEAMFHVALVVSLKRPAQVSKEEHDVIIDLMDFIAWKCQQVGAKGDRTEITIRWLSAYNRLIFESPPEN